jgi:drug/metabolite transporter (DMT)-like permease
MHIAVLLAVAILIQAAGNVCLSIGMKGFAVVAASQPDAWGTLALMALTEPMIVIGVLLLLGFFILFATVLAGADLSVAMPIVSFEIVLNVALAYLIIGEEVSPLRWAGTALVAAGVACVALSAGDKRPAGKTRA